MIRADSTSITADITIVVSSVLIKIPPYSKVIPLGYRGLMLYFSTIDDNYRQKTTKIISGEHHMSSQALR
jgi:hypothetical protein